MIRAARWGVKAAALLSTVPLLVLPAQQAPPQDVVQPHPQVVDADEGAGPTDAGGLEAFLDGVMGAQLREKEIAGATIAVVRGGEILLAKGYGFADVENRSPVDPERTLFRIGSATKLFTWIGVMQLVEAGLLDLDVDVNQYLDFTIPDTYPEPITLRHLMTHTPGFEEDSRDLFTEDVDGIVPMDEWLADNLPARVRPPGEFSAYSNYGTALAGLIVQNVSGQDWDTYTEERIFQPLGMEYSTTRQPLPERLEPHMSKGYSRQGGRWVEEDWEVITGAAPAGSVSAPAVDMARFMLSQLGGGELDGERILSEAGTREMHATHFVHDERLPGFGLGFYSKSSHGVEIVGHGGNTQWFHTDLALFPEEDLGVFVSYNSAAGGELSFDGFLSVFLDHYYPSGLPQALDAEGFEERVQGLAGTYLFNRASYTTFQRSFSLLGGVSFDVADDALVQSGGVSDTNVRLVEVDTELFQEEFGQGQVAFRTDETGRATHAFLSGAPMMALERVPWYGAPRTHQVLLGGAVLIFLGMVLAGLGRGIRALRGRPRDGDQVPGSARTARRALLVTAGAHVAFALALVLLLSDPYAILTGPATGLYLALALPVLGLMATLVAGVAVVRAFRKGEGSGWLRSRLAATVMLALLVSLSLHYWNLLGWRV